MTGETHSGYACDVSAEKNHNFKDIGKLTDLFLYALGLAACVGGAATLYLAWRAGREHPRHARGIWAGWMLLAAGTGVWVVPAGADRAVSFMLLWAGLVALACIAATTSWTREQRRRERERPANDVEPAPLSGTVGHGIAVALVAGPLSFAAATAATLALLTVTTAKPGATALVGGALLAPVLWAGAMLWSCADSRLARPALWLSAATAALGALVIVLR